MAFFVDDTHGGDDDAVDEHFIYHNVDVVLMITDANLSNQCLLSLNQKINNSRATYKEALFYFYHTRYS